MAIEAITNPKMTYQGSVSQTEAPVMASQKVSGSSAPGTAMNEKENPAADTGIRQEQNPEDEPVLQVGTEAMKKAVEEINRNSKNSEAIFGIHDATNRVTIKIVDKDTKKVIKEFPPEKTLDMIAKVWEMAGLMVDEKR